MTTIKKPKSQKKINDIQEMINEKVSQSLDVANREMGEVQKSLFSVDSRMSNIETHVTWIRDVYEDWQGRVEKIEDRTWQILISVILGFLGSLLMFGLSLYFK